MALDNNSDPGTSHSPGECSYSRQPPAWYSLDEAREAVEAVLRRFLSNLDWLDADDPKPALALRVTVGVGKSHIIRMLLAEVAHAVLMRGHILIFVSTHKLAEEAEAAFRSLGAGVPTMVLRGRDVTDTVTGEPLCQKADLARRIAMTGGSVSAALCQAEEPETKRFFRAPCRRGCAWYAQLPAEDEHRVVFMPHAYLRSPIPIKGNVALRIIDEKCLGDIMWTQSVWVDDWLEPCSCASAARGGSPTCIHAARDVVHTALLRRQPIVAALEAAGFTPDRVKSFAAYELLDQPELSVTRRRPKAGRRRLRFRRLLQGPSPRAALDHTGRDLVGGHIRADQPREGGVRCRAASFGHKAALLSQTAPRQAIDHARRRR